MQWYFMAFMPLFIELVSLGNERRQISWTSTSKDLSNTNEERLRQLRVKKLCLMTQLDDRKQKTLSCRCKRTFNMPQVPPPSRSPSKTSIIEICTRDTDNETDTDGFQEDKNDLSSLNSETFVPTTKEMRLQQDVNNTEKENSALNDEVGIRTRKDFLFTKKRKATDKEANGLRYLNLILNEHKTHDKRESKSTYQHESITNESPLDLVHTVRRLKVDTTKVLRCPKQPLDEKINTSTHKSKDECSLQNCETMKEIGKRNPDIKTCKISNHGTTNSSSSTCIVKNYKDLSKVHHQKNGKDLRESGKNVGRSHLEQNTKLNRKSDESARQTTKDAERAVVEHCREKVAKIGKGTEINGKENSAASIRTTTTHCNARMVVEQFRLHNVNDTCFDAKNFTTMSTKKQLHETATKQKKQRSMSGIHVKIPQAKTVPRKSCSASTVRRSATETSGYSAIQSKSEAAASNSVRKALKTHTKNEVSDERERKLRSPANHLFPSQAQLENFDEIVQHKVRKTLSLQMRKHCLVKSCGFPRKHEKS